MYIRGTGRIDLEQFAINNVAMSLYNIIKAYIVIKYFCKSACTVQF